LTDWAARAPDRPILITERGELTVADLARHAQSTARKMAGATVVRGRPVLLLAPRPAEWLIGALAAYWAGAVVVPIATDTTPHELRLIGDQLRPALALCARISPDGLDCDRIELAPEERGGCAVDETGAHTTLVSRSPDLPMAIFYTSGTTGRPRGVVHSQRSLLAGAGRPPHQPPSASAHRADRPWLRLFTSYPLASIAGFMVVLRALLEGHTVITVTSFHPRRALQMIQRWRAIGILGGPAHARLMLRLRDFDRYDLTSVRFMNLGGDHVPQDLAVEVERRFECAVGITYGTTELGGVVTMSRLSDPQQVRTSGVGQPIDGVEVRVLDDAGQDVEPGRQGELFVRSQSQALGIYGTRAIQSVTGDGGWIATGDLAVREDLGAVRIVGRKRGLIIRAGRKVTPEEVEAILLSDPSVAMARVLAAEDSAGSQRVRALVVPAASAGPGLEHALLRRCRERLAPYKVPDQIRLVDSLSTTTMGKVRRRDDVSPPAVRMGHHE
jgi:long-chain acyl-CoA synthetase